MSLNPHQVLANVYQQHSPLTGALRTGIDTDGTILYLCRGILLDSIQPGKIWAGFNRCIVSYNGKEIAVDKFTIPNHREFGHAEWTQSIQGALQIGKDSNGKPLFICQSQFNGSIQPGKTWQGYNHCNITYAGHEVITDHFRVLSNTKDTDNRLAATLYRKTKLMHY